MAVVTPFSRGEVDYDALGRLIEYQIEGGTQGLVPCGTTGESPTLSHVEHDKVIEFTVERAAGRLPVIAGTGSTSTAEAVRLTRHAEAELPIVLYNIPSRTGIELAPETIVRMYNEIDMVVGIKEATGKLDMASAVAAGFASGTSSSPTHACSRISAGLAS